MTTFNPLDWQGPAFLALYGGLLVVLVILVIVRWIAAGKSIRHDGVVIPEDLSYYHIAFLARGREGAVQAVLAALHARGSLEVKGGTFIISVEDPPPADPFEYQAIQVGGGTEISLGDFTLHLSPAVEMLEADLEERGLLIWAKGKRKEMPVLTALLVALLVFGLAKFGLGLSRGKPVSILGLFLFLTGVIATKVGGRKTRITELGKSVLGAFRTRHTKQVRQPGEASATESPVPDTIPLLVGLYGVGMMQTWGFSDFHQLVPVPAKTWIGDIGGTASSCGSDGGSSCGGGGCGGCGGGD